MARLLDRRSLADHENLAHLLPSTKSMIIARKNSHIQSQPCNKTGKLKPNNIFNMQSNIFSPSHPHSNQTYYDSSFNTLRLDSTHPDTYNLVGFSGCLHLWWIPLLEHELLIPELCVTNVMMNQISLTTRLALNEFRASCYSHHRSQSALSETNWPLRVSGYSPYLESLLGYTDGAPPWTPTNRAMGLRPDH